VLNYGCAGAHRADLLLGDVVVGTRVVAYEQDGVVAADADLLAAARRVADAYVDGYEAWPVEVGWPPGVAHRLPRIEFGTVASADRWNRSVEVIAELAAQYDSVCEDMEAAAIGVVCASARVPFLSVKDISNNELLSETVDGAALLEGLREQAARRAASFVLAVMREAFVQN